MNGLHRVGIAMMAISRLETLANRYRYRSPQTLILILGALKVGIVTMVISRSVIIARKL
jgi:hypothetical protein